MLRLLGTLLVTICILNPIPAVAQNEYFPNGNELLKYCKKFIYVVDNLTYDEEGYMGVQCMGFVEGLESFHYINAKMLSKYDKSTIITNKFLYYCKPGEVTKTQTIRVIIKYLENNPKKLHRSAGFLVLEALEDAFPCKNDEEKSK